MAAGGRKGSKRPAARKPAAIHSRRADLKTPEQLIEFARAQLRLGAQSFACAGWALLRLKEDVEHGAYLRALEHLEISKQTASYAIAVCRLLGGGGNARPGRMAPAARALDGLSIAQIKEVACLGAARVERLLARKQLDVKTIAAMPRARLREHVRELRALADGKPPPPPREQPARTKLADVERAQALAAAIRDHARALRGLLPSLSPRELAAIAGGVRKDLAAAQAALAEAGVGE